MSTLLVPDPSSETALKGTISNMKNRKSRIGFVLCAICVAGLSNRANAGFNDSISNPNNYAVVVGSGVVGSDIYSGTTATTVYGGVGLATTSPHGSFGYGSLVGGTVTINGNLDFGGGGAAFPLRGGTVTGTTNQNVGGPGGPGTLYSSITTLSKQLSLEAATTIATGATQINTGDGSLDVSGNEVFTVTAANFLNNPLTINYNGTGSHSVVINVVGNGSNVILANSIYLSGGLTASNVLINIVDSGGLVTASRSSSIAANVFAVGDDVFLGSAAISGMIAGGNTSFVLADVVIGVPEPSSLAMVLIAGGLATGVTAYRKRASKQAKTA